MAQFVIVNTTSHSEHIIPDKVMHFRDMKNAATAFKVMLADKEFDHANTVENVRNAGLTVCIRRHDFCAGSVVFEHEYVSVNGCREETDEYLLVLQENTYELLKSLREGAEEELIRDALRMGWLNSHTTLDGVVELLEKGLY